MSFGLFDKDDQSLVWDENDRLIDQVWSELKKKIRETPDGLRIIADDFEELLR